jgi:hypothetical protein
VAPRRADSSGLPSADGEPAMSQEHSVLDTLLTEIRADLQARRKARESVRGRLLCLLGWHDWRGSSFQAPILGRTETCFDRWCWRCEHKSPRWT